LLKIVCLSLDSQDTLEELSMSLTIIILALAIPAGYLIAWLARDELVIGRKWLKILILISAFLFGFFLLGEQRYVAWTGLFILVVSFISLIKSFDKKWTGKTKKRI